MAAMSHPVNPAVTQFLYGALVVLLLALVLLGAALWRWRSGRPEAALGAGALVALGVGLVLLFLGSRIA